MSLWLSLNLLYKLGWLQNHGNLPACLRFLSIGLKGVNPLISLLDSHTFWLRPYSSLLAASSFLV